VKGIYKMLMLTFVIKNDELGFILGSYYQWLIKNILIYIFSS